MCQTARQATWDDGCLREVGAKRIIFDRDTKYCAAWQNTLVEESIQRIPLPEDTAAYLKNSTWVGGRLTPPHSARRDYLERCRALRTASTQPAITDFMTINLADWNRSGDDYAIGASLIAFFIENKDGTVKAAFHHFMTALRETQNYDKALATGFARVDWKKLDDRFWTSF